MAVPLTAEARIGSEGYARAVPACASPFLGRVSCKLAAESRSSIPPRTSSTAARLALARLSRARCGARQKLRRMDDLFPDLCGFTPRASTSRAIAIDPALQGQRPASSAALTRRQASGRAGDAYWDDEDDEDGGAGALFGFAPRQSGRDDASTASQDDDDDDDDHGDDESLDGSEYETDAVDEFAATTQVTTGQAARRGDKGKGRAQGRTAGGDDRDDDDQRFALDDRGDEDLEYVPPSLAREPDWTGESPPPLTRAVSLRSRLISAIRDSNSTQVGGSTALGREFDRSIADELDAFDPEMMENLTVGVKGKKRKKKGGKSVRSRHPLAMLVV